MEGAESGMTILKAIAMRLLARAQSAIVIPATQWALRDEDLPKPETATAEYTEPSATLNAAVLQMAQKDREALLDSQPELFQAELNGLMGAMRAEGLNQQMLIFFGSLMQQGYPPEECMLRSAANSLHLGMFLQKRLGTA